MLCVMTILEACSAKESDVKNDYCTIVSAGRCSLATETKKKRLTRNILTVHSTTFYATQGHRQVSVFGRADRSEFGTNALTSMVRFAEHQGILTIMNLFIGGINTNSLFKVIRRRCYEIDGVRME